MATTLQNILATLRALNAVPEANVNYGITDDLSPPYVNVINYTHTITYDTGGASILDAKYSVLVTDKGQDEAETIAKAIDDAINSGLSTSSAITPTSISNLQASYAVGQIEGQGYQYVVKIDYELQETIAQ